MRSIGQQFNQKIKIGKDCPNRDKKANFIFCRIHFQGYLANIVLIVKLMASYPLNLLQSIINYIMRKGQSWTPQEDQMLIKLHKQAGCFQRWKFISRKFKNQGIQKTQFQCRDRFTNHIDPSLKHGKLSKGQIIKLFTYYDEYGPRWSFFETKILGRSQSLLKNKFYSTLRSLVRLLIKAGHKKKFYEQKISSSNLSSKLLTDFYEGRKKFSRFKSFLKNCLKQISYQIQQDGFDKFLMTVCPEQLKNLYYILGSCTNGNQQINQEEPSQIVKAVPQKYNLKKQPQNKDQRLHQDQLKGIISKNELEGERNIILQHKKSQQSFSTVVMFPIDLQWNILVPSSPFGFYYYN